MLKMPRILGFGRTPVNDSGMELGVLIHNLTLIR